MRRLRHLFDLINLLCVQVTVSRNIFIAKNGGNNEQSCGTATGPCKSIQFAIKTISISSEDIMFLDGGGVVNPSVYYIDEPIVLQRNLNLWKCKDSLLNPIISYLGSSTIMMHAFVVPSSASLNVMIHSVDFSNVGTVLCNASKECNITILNSNSKVNNQNLTTRSQIALYDFLFSHLSIENCSFDNTAFAMYADSKRRSSLRVSIANVQLTKSKIDYRLKAAQGKVYGEINRLIATCSSSVFVSGSNLHLNLSSSLFFSNKYDSRSRQSDDDGILVKFISSSRSNGSFVRISNVQFYNNTRYKVLLEVAGERLGEKNSILESVIENIYADGNEMYWYESVLVNTSTTSSNIRNVTVRSMEIGAILSIKARSFNVRNIQLSAIVAGTLVSLLEGDGDIDNITCTSSVLAFGFKTNSLRNARIMNVILIDITWKLSFYYLFSLETFTNVTIKNITIINNRKMNKLFVFKKGTNSSVDNISVTNSSGNEILFNVEDSVYIQFQNIHVENNEIYQLFEIGRSKNLMVQTLCVVKHTIRQSLVDAFELENSIVTEVFVQNNTIEANLLKLSNTKNTLISNWTISGNNISKGQLLKIACSRKSDKCIDVMNMKLYHNMVLHNSAIILQNTNKHPRSTFRGMHFQGNHIQKYVFDIAFYNFILTSAYIKNNSYETCIHARNSLISMRDVNIKGNHATGRVKETHFVYSKVGVPASVTVMLSNISISTYDATSMIALSSRDANYWDLKEQMSMVMVMEKVTVNVLSLQTRAWQMKLSVPNDTVMAVDYKVQCPRGSFNTHSNTRKEYGFHIISSCSVCEKGTYNLHGSSFRARESELRTVNRYSSEDLCTKCPYGGACANGNSISRGNFFGFEMKRSQLTYIPCPLSYCCSEGTVKCTDRNTCSLYRRGTLCGDCITGYHENLFGTLCNKISDCSSKIGFWAFHSLAAALLLFLHCYMDCIKTVFSTIAVFLHRCFHRCRKAENKCRTKYTITKSEQPSATNDNNKNNHEYEKQTSETRNKQARQAKQTSETNNSNFTSSIQIKERLVLEKNNTGVERCSKLKNSSIQLLENETTEFTENSVTKRQPDNTEFSVSQTPRTALSTDQSSYTISGIIQVLIYFYQIRSLIYIDLNQDNNFVVPNLLDDIINAKMFLDIGDTFCPYLGLDAVGKAFINNVMLGINMMFLLSLTYLLNSICRIFTANKKVQQCSKPRMSFHCRLEVCYLRLLLFSYKNVATFCFLVLNCVSTGDEYILYIKGTTTCFQSWQYLFIGFGICWVLPFPFVLSYTYQLYRQKCITFHILMVCVTFPPSTLFLIASNLCKPLQSFLQPNAHQLNVLKQIFEEPYRLRKGETTDNYIFWEHFRLLQSLLISAVVTFVIDPLWRNMILMPFILFFHYVYIKVRPLKKNLVVLYWMEIASSLALCYHVLFNLFKAFLYVLSIPAEGPVQNIKLFVTYSEAAVSPIIVLVTYFLFIPLYKRILKVVRREKVE